MKITADEMRIITKFEHITHCTVKDCIIDGNDLTLIVKEGEIGLAIGKKGLIINKIKKELGKEIHVYEYSDEIQKFIKNMFYPIKINNIEISEQEAKIFMEAKAKKRAIGKDGKKIENVKEITSRHFNINKIRIM